MTECVIAIFETVAECLVDTIKQELSYLFCYQRFKDDLIQKAKNLKKARDDVQITVDKATRRGDQIRPIVQEWLDRVDKITEEAEELMKDENKSCFNGWCPNIKSRYLLSREADKKTQVINGVQDDRNFPDGVSYRVPPQSITFKNYESFGSRALILNEIMNALRDAETKMIGVWGMGGVGKTTLVKQVIEEAKQGNLFTKAVYIDVSWTRDSETIQQRSAKTQQNIADVIGFEFAGTDESTKADELKQRLQREKTLIILDDIWKEIDLEKVGLPCKDDEGESKIVLASRREDLLRKSMGAQKCFPVKHLPQKEAWSLFNKTAGGSLEENVELRPIAMEVVEECEGLPIAIVTIAKALKGERVDVWKNALDELRNSDPTNIIGVEEKVYGCLKWSYNKLEGPEVKSLFLLCGTLSYGYISMDDLLRYGMGLGLFKNTKSLEQARNRLVTLVKILKASSLLLDRGDPIRDSRLGATDSSLLFVDADIKFVRMHDVVRDVARAIVSEDSHLVMVKDVVGLQEWPENDEFRNCTRISLECRDMDELPEGLVCPELECFLLNTFYHDSLRIPDSFFKEMKQLKVLGLFGTHFTSLPSSLHFLSNLQTLCLEYCQSTKNVTAIGELKKLRVLRLVHCGIEELPREMMQLTDLKVLDLQNCLQLKIIPGNLISSLTRLEYLCMKNNLFQWKVEGATYAWLLELKGLKYLSVLDVQIPYPDLLNTEYVLFEVEKLTRYSIMIGENDEDYKRHEDDVDDPDSEDSEDDETLIPTRSLTLSKVEKFPLVEWFSKLLTKTQFLYLCVLDDTYKHVHNSKEGFPELKHLHLFHCPGIQYIVNSMEWAPKSGASPALETLCSRELNNLEAVCYGPIPGGSFDELRILHASDCERLKYLILLPTAKEREYLEFPKLQSLQLCELPKLVSFYSVENSATSTSDVHVPFFNHQVALPSLTFLDMHGLDDIKTLWHIQLPSDSFCKLESLSIGYCRKLLNVCPFNILKGLQCLKTLIIRHCESVEEVFNVGGMNGKEIHDIESSSNHFLPSLKTSFDMRHIFQNLKVLQVSDCDSVKEVIQVKEPTGEEDKVEIVFTKLLSLVLFNLPNLTSFCSARYAFKFPSLEDIWVTGCPKMEYFCNGVLSTPMLLGLGRDDSGEPDLNTTIKNKKECHEGVDWRKEYGI